MVTEPPATRPGGATSILGPGRLGYFTPVHDQPILADRKAMFILGASGLMASVLLFFAHPLGTLVHTRGVTAAVFVIADLTCVAILLLAAAVMAYYAYTRPVPPMPPNFAWFRTIAGTSRADYERQLRALDHAAALRGMLHYNYSIASQAAHKFRWVNRSLRCLRVAIPLWMVLLLALAVWG